MPGTLSVALQREQERIETIAREMGLTFFRVVFEMVDWREMNALAAYGGFPTRYPHWRWGMEYAELATRIIEERFPVADWNLYMFHFTDGENYSRQDSDKSADLLEAKLLPAVNLFGYGQVEALGTRGDFIDVLRSRFASHERVALSRIPDRDAIVVSIKDFLGRGR